MLILQNNLIYLKKEIKLGPGGIIGKAVEGVADAAKGAAPKPGGGGAGLKAPMSPGGSGSGDGNAKLMKDLMTPPAPPHMMAAKAVMTAMKNPEAVMGLLNKAGPSMGGGGPPGMSGGGGDLMGAVKKGMGPLKGLLNMLKNIVPAGPEAPGADATKKNGMKLG